MTCRFITADVFTDQIFGGNRLAVFPDAVGLKSEWMQAIARELNLSETVFVVPAADSRHACRLRIFTPLTELPFAGHPTIGSAVILAVMGALGERGDAWELSAKLEVGAGPVSVAIRLDGSSGGFAQLEAPRLPHPGPQAPPAVALARMLSLETSDLADPPLVPATFSAGVPFMFVPLRSEGAVSRARLDSVAWSEVAAKFWAPNVYLFSLQRQENGGRVRARMFAPALGVPEDPATGVAAVALAGYLGERESAAEGRFRWVISQGIEMGRPSVLHLEAVKLGGAVAAVRLGGSAVLVSEGAMRLPDGS